jgi:hypothetical protein
VTHRHTLDNHARLLILLLPWPVRIEVIDDVVAHSGSEKQSYPRIWIVAMRANEVSRMSRGSFPLFLLGLRTFFPAHDSSLCLSIPLKSAVFRACLFMEVAQLAARLLEAEEEPLRERCVASLNQLLMSQLEDSQGAIAQDRAVAWRSTLYTVHDGAGLGAIGEDGPLRPGMVREQSR